jgi:hypothetical protein
MNINSSIIFQLVLTNPNLWICGSTENLIKGIEGIWECCTMDEIWKIWPHFATEDIWKSLEKLAQVRHEVGNGWTH